MKERILLVDDEPHILAGYKRHLRKEYNVLLAEGGNQALQLIAADIPFAVVVSDMKMPDVNGITVLTEVARHHPDTVRVMLTGDADQRTAVDAVNEGNIFRFLSKPCPPDSMARTLEAAVRQYRLVRAEHELLTKTLSGSVSLMVQMMSLMNPKAYGQASRVRRFAREVATRMNVENSWEVEIAAMLSQIGCVAIPNEVVDKVVDGIPLKAEEQRMWDEHPKTGSDLVRTIPRLEGAADLIALQRHDSPDPSTPLGARVLKVVLDHDALSAVTSPPEALHTMLHERAEQYDKEVLQTLSQLVTSQYATKKVEVIGLREGMVFDQNVETLTGSVLISKGQEVTESLINRLQNFEKSTHGVQQPIAVRCYDETAAEQQSVADEKAPLAEPQLVG